MKHGRFHSVAILTGCLLVCAASAQAQEVFVNVAENFLKPATNIKNLVLEPRRFQAFDVGILWQAAETEAAGIYASPRVGIGFSYANLGSLACVPGSRMGDSFSIYVRFERAFIQTSSFSAGYDLELGPALMTHYYDRYTNPDNRLYGGPYSNHIKMGAFGRLQVGRNLALRAELNFRHNSAGRIFVPNGGLNSYSCALGASYAVGSRTIHPGAHRPEGDPLDRKFRVSVFAAGGVHRCMAEFKADLKLPLEERQDAYTPWFKGSVGADVIWRYSRRTSTGVQMELHYLSNMEALKRADDILFGPGERKYAPLAPGIGIIQDLYFGSFTAGVGVGAYLFRAFGEHEDHGLLYQKVGLRYYPPALKRMFAGVAIRAHHFGTADYIEFSFGTVL